MEEEKHRQIRMQTSKIVVFWPQNTHTHSLKRQCTQNESLFGADFGPEAYIGHFFGKRTKMRLRYRTMLNEVLLIEIEE